MASPKSIFRSSMEAWHRRRRATALPLAWNVGALAADLRAEVQAAEQQGLLDPRLLDDFEAELVTMMLQALPPVMAAPRDAVGFGVAEAVFGRVVYTNGLDRQLATGASAVAEVAVEEAVSVVAAAVLLRFCGARVPPEPQWPSRDGTVGVGPSVGPPGDIVGGERPDDDDDDSGVNP